MYPNFCPCKAHLLVRIVPPRFAKTITDQDQLYTLRSTLQGVFFRKLQVSEAMAQLLGASAEGPAQEASPTNGVPETPQFGKREKATGLKHKTSITNSISISL